MAARMTAQQFVEFQERRRADARPGPPRRAPKRAAGPPSTPPPPAVAPLLAGLAGAGRHWVLLMPYAEELLTSNQRLHHMAVHRIRKQLRADAAHIARIARLPRLERAAVFYVLHPRPLTRKRDPGNWAPTAKAYVDGLVTDGGLLPDDSHDFLFGPIPVMGDPVPTGKARMSIVVVEIPEPLTSRNADSVTGNAGSTY
ncbi:hypothetical protein ACWGMW_16295 [Streptomyces albidoflavus]